MKRLSVPVENGEQEKKLLDWLASEHVTGVREEDTAEVIQKNAKKIKLLASVSLFVIVFLGCFLIWLMMDNQKLSSQLNTQKNEIDALKQMATSYRDSLVLRHKILPFRDSLK
ncbi:MAG: hypothetical protein EAZ67_04250 [Cytophagales bacterium]|nr:MAG: hypothetical protein EAZ67_04250 [Cytophagales bacterium]